MLLSRAARINVGDEEASGGLGKGARVVGGALSFETVSETILKKIYT